MRGRSIDEILKLLVLAGGLIAAQSLAACSGRERDPAGSGLPGPSSEDLYVLRANGIVCVTHPCFGIEAVPVAGPGRPAQISDVDFSGLDLSEAVRDSLVAEMMGGRGVTAAGRFEVVPDAGPAGDGWVFRVTFVQGLATG